MSKSTTILLLTFIVFQQICLIKKAFPFPSTSNCYSQIPTTLVAEPSSSSSATTAVGGEFHPIHVYSVKDGIAKGSQSQVNQDNILIALMNKIHKNDKKGSFFVDLASNNAISLSNTVYLEENGWNGLCIEPNPIYWYDLAHHRKCTVIGSLVGGTEDGEEVEVTFTNTVLGGIIGEGMDNEKEKIEEEGDYYKVEKRNTVSLQTVFKDYNVPSTIDYLSLDVEGAETLIMKDFPFSDYKFSFMTVERPKDDLKKILQDNGYIYITNFVFWGETLWMHESSGLSKEEALEVACKAKKGGIESELDNLEQGFYQGDCADILTEEP